ncbi:MAG: flagellar motor protein [Acidobacteria bacterium]|nr:flagellar motor protein [Acidobacteriota bacterium]MBI3472009.1 flagellar motor protein [Candidatus Solibacter usitatus]
MAAPGGKKPGSKPDISSLAGLAIAIGGILGGLILEGGKVTDVAQITAAVIVLGGTIGAVMLSTPLPVLLSAAKQLSQVFFDRSHGPDGIIEQIIALAGKARKNGMVSLENDVDQIDDPFLKKALSLAVDGTDLQELRKMMELEIALEEQQAEAEAKVYELAGGYAPTVGIIGAVLGLIQVMKHLENIEEVGHGIAVAFVATVYGVAAANLFFLPAAGKLKARAHHSAQTKELMLEGVGSIVEGMNPKLILIKLEAYAHGSAGKTKKEKQRAGAVSQPASA